MRYRRSLLFVALLVATTLWASAPVWAQVTGADEICSPVVDPCVIDTPIQTGFGTVLDFADRELRIIGTGQIKTDGNRLTIRCGKLTVATGGNEAAIDLSGPGANGESVGGVATIEVHRRCSLDTSVLCLSDSVCERRPVPVGTCSVGRGQASVAGRISGNADSPGLFTLRAAGDITVDAPITMNAAHPDEDGGSIDLSSGGSIVVNAKLSANSGFFGTGGDVFLDASGDVVLNGGVEVIGGDFDGGFLDVFADRDIRVTEDINANANDGEGYGGEIALDARRDIVIVGGASGNRLVLSADGHLSSELFGGDGGFHSYVAVGNITMGPFVRLSSVGAPPDGSGDSIELDAQGDVLMEADIDCRADPAGASGTGGLFSVTALGSIAVTTASKIDLTGPQAGGDLSIDALGSLSFAGTVDAHTGNDGIPGSAQLLSDAAVLSFAGDVSIDGASPSLTRNLVELNGCDVEFTNAGRIDNKVGNSRTQVFGRESIHVATGGEILGETAQGNEFRYRSGTPLPDIDGNVSPAPVLIADPGLLECPVCGNGELERTETCDDGNTVPEDGCSSDCQNESCIAQTPGYPQAPLCGDGNGCTVDQCNPVTGQCEHQENCDDGIACTIDSCGVSKVCLHQASPLSCDDGVGCTTDRCCTGAGGACRGLRGCVSTPANIVCNDGEACTDDVCDAEAGCITTAKTGPCDDSLVCTTSDQCVGGVCQGVSTCPAGEICDPVSGQCQLPPTTTTSTTTTSTTTTTTLPPTTTTTSTTTLPPPGFCGDQVVVAPEECDDGSSGWLVGQFCNAACSMLSCGDPDDSGSLSAPDALFILRSAVGLSACDVCICNVDGSAGGSPITATDALRALRRAVGIPIALTCPACI